MYIVYKHHFVCLFLYGQLQNSRVVAHKLLICRAGSAVLRGLDVGNTCWRKAPACSIVTLHSVTVTEPGALLKHSHLRYSQAEKATSCFNLLLTNVSE